MNMTNTPDTPPDTTLPLWRTVPAGPLLVQMLEDCADRTLPPDLPDYEPLPLPDTQAMMRAFMGHTDTLAVAGSLSPALHAGLFGYDYHPPMWWRTTLTAVVAWPSAWTLLTPHPDPDLPPEAVRAMAPAVAVGYTLRGA
jgi:hypothetical protein